MTDAEKIMMESIKKLAELLNETNKKVDMLRNDFRIVEKSQEQVDVANNHMHRLLNILESTK